MPIATGETLPTDRLILDYIQPRLADILQPEIEFVGLRPGEKLFEELSHKGENITPTAHPKIMRFVSDAQALEGVKELFTNLDARVHQADAEELKLLLRNAVPEYQPYLA